MFFRIARLLTLTAWFWWELAWWGHATPTGGYGFGVPESTQARFWVFSDPNPESN